MSQVTSKPDLYPLVFTCNADSGKNGASYLMVQYFRNYIVRPSGSLSATSTIDSLSSSYICTANEANILVPPPYSRAASPDLPVATNNGHDYSGISRSASQQGCSFGYYTYRPIPAVFAVPDDDANNLHPHRQQQLHHANSSNNNHNSNNHHHHHQQQYNFGTQAATAATADTPSAMERPIGPLRTSESVNFERTNSNSSQNAHDSTTNMNLSHSDQQFRYNANSCSNLSGNGHVYCGNSKVIGLTSANSLNLDSMLSGRAKSHATQLFGSGPIGGSVSDLGNGAGGSICMATDGGGRARGIFKMRNGNGIGCSGNGGRNSTGDSSDARLPHTQQFSEESPVINVDVLKKYESMRSYLNSMTGSAVSSLTNIDFPTSPPQATSPTGEVKELLEQIRQLQSENSTDGLSDGAGASSNIVNDFPNDLAQCSPELQPLTMAAGATKTKRPSTLQQQLQQRKSARTRYFPMSNTRSICSPISSNSWLGFGRSHKRWVSRSAPSTPDTGLLPSFLQDHSPLLNEHDEETEQNT